MERKQKIYRPSPTGEYFGLFVRGSGESRSDSWRVENTLILQGPLFATEAMRVSLEADAMRMRICGQDAGVRTVRRGESIVVREIPENSVTVVIVD